MRQLEADNIRAALKAANGKVSGPRGAAGLLGLKPTTLASRIKALGIVPANTGTRD
jgi:transcriptional regulator with GAF, ATPase, and Fis domain